MVLFAVQHGGWCAGAKDLNGYKKYGKAGNCKDGKGGPSTNDVYQIHGLMTVPRIPVTAPARVPVTAPPRPKTHIPTRPRTMKHVDPIHVEEKLPPTKATSKLFHIRFAFT